MKNILTNWLAVISVGISSFLASSATLGLKLNPQVLYGLLGLASLTSAGNQFATGKTEDLKNPNNNAQ